MLVRRDGSQSQLGCRSWKVAVIRVVRVMVVIRIIQRRL